MKRLPRRIRVMGQVFTTTRPRRLSMPGKELNNGCMDDSYFQIEIAKRLNGSAKWDAWCHEWAHAVLGVTGLNQRMTEEQEEALAQSFGSALREFCEQMGLRLD